MNMKKDTNTVDGVENHLHTLKITVWHVTQSAENVGKKDILQLCAGQVELEQLWKMRTAPYF